MSMFLAFLFVSSVFASSPIIDGDDANLKDYPWQVSIQYAEIKGFHYCGGAIIDATHILTAAHCVSDTTHPFEITAGGDGSRAKLKNLPTVKKVSIHPEYRDDQNRSEGFDIAVLEMSRPILFSASIQPILLPDSKTEQETYFKEDVFAITGWGYDRTGQTTAQLKVVQGLSLKRKKAGDLFFAFNVKNHHTSCLGDSGGPLVRMDTKTLIGLSSYGSSSDCLNRDGFYYTNLYRYLDWIRSVL